jgi:hypothetical protein
MLTRLIGDIHGKWYEYQLLTQSIEYRSIQVGDFGIGFGQGDYWHERVNEFHTPGQHRFMRGNHDDPTKCKTEMVGYIPDGTIENDVMLVGGAWSIDRDWRTPGVDWWEDEELSYQELNNLIGVYETVKPRVMITHDCPTLAAYYMFIRNGKSIGGNVQHLTRTGEALQAMFEIHQPEQWYFGHWHHTKSMDINGTRFQCIGELDFIDVEL